MGKLTLLLALLGMGLFAMRQSGSTSRTLFAVQSSSAEGLADVVARSSALAGFVRVEQALSESFEDVTVTGAFEGGTFASTATVADGVATVTSVGIVDRLFAQPDSFQIRALVMPLGDPEQLPRFLAYSMLVGGDLSMGGNSEIVSLGVVGDAASTYNPLVHANGNLHVSSSATRAIGFGSYSGSMTGKGGESTFTPVANPDGLPTVQKVDPIEIPPFSQDAITEAYGATVTYPSPNGEYWAAQLQGALLGGPRDAPAVYRIHGNVQLNDVTVDGYAIFLADGRTEINGTVRGINPDPAYPNQSQIAIYTGGELTMGGNASVYAQVIAQGGLSFNGNVDIYGSVVTHGNFSNGGGAVVHARPASPALSRPWQEGTAGIGVLAYVENALGVRHRR